MAIDIEATFDASDIKKGAEEYIKSIQKAQDATEKVSGGINTSLKGLRENTRRQIEEVKKSILNFSYEINNEKNIIKGIEADVKNIQNSFNKAAPGRMQASIKPELERAKKVLNEEKAALNDLQNKQQQAKLTLQNLKNEYAGYTEQIKQSTKQTNKYAEAFKLLPQPIRNAVNATKAFTKSAAAFIATPLGLILGALALAYKSVSLWANNSAEGQIAFARSSAYLEGILKELKETAMSVGKTLYMAFTDPKQAVFDLGNSIAKNVTNRFKAFGKGWEATSKLFSGEFKEGIDGLLDSFVEMSTGVSDLSKKVTGYVSDAEKMANANQKIKDSEIALAKSQREASITLAEYEEKIAEARRKATDRSLENEQRLQSNNEAKKMINERFDLEKRLAEEELRIQREKMKLKTDPPIEDLNKEVELIVKLKNIDRQRANSLRELNETGGTVAREIAASQKASAEATTEGWLKADKEKIALLENSKSKSIALIELETKERLAALDKEQKALEEKNKKAGIKGLTSEQTETFTVRRNIIYEDENKKRFDIEKEYNDETEKLYEQLTDVFLTEEERKTKAVQQRYDEMRKATRDQYEAEIKAIEVTKAEPEKQQAKQQATIQFKETNALIDAAQVQENLNEVLEKYKSFTQQRIEIEDKYNKHITTLQKQLNSTTDEATKERIKGALKVAQESMNKAISSLNLEEFQAEIDWSSVFGNLNKLSTDALKKLRDKIKEYLSTAGDSISKEDFKTVVDAFENLDAAITNREPINELVAGYKEYKAAVKEVTKAKKELDKADNPEEKERAVKNLSAAEKKRAESLSKMTQSVNAIGQQGQQVISAGNDLVDMLTNLGIKVPESISGTLSGLGQVMDGLASIDLTKPMSAVTGVISSLTGVAKMIGSVFGLGSDNGIAQYKALREQLEAINNLYKKIIDKSKEKIVFGGGFASVEAAKEANEALKKQIENYKRLAEVGGKAGASAGSHSYAYRANERLKKSWTDISKSIGQNISSVQQMYKLSGEQLEIIRRKFPEEWSKIPTEITENLDAIIACNDEVKELANNLQEALTGISFDSFYNGFIDSLSDMDTSFEDMCDDFEGYLRKSIIAGLVASQYKGRIEQLYKSWTQAAESGNKITGKEAENLQNEYKNIIQDMIKDRENLAKTFNWEISPEELKRQTGTISETITEKTATESMGIWRGSFDTLKSIDNKVLTFHEAYKNTMATCNALLSDIAQNTGNTANNTYVLSEMNETLSRMDGRLKTLESNSTKKYI